MMKTLGRTILMGCAGALLANSSIAQEGSLDIPSLAKTSLLIVNSADIALHFAVRPGDGTWKNFSVQPKGQVVISCDQCSTPNFEFRMKTETKEVAYNLDPKNRYVLDWNSGNQYWDIYLAR